jgi:hypothetical protein
MGRWIFIGCMLVGLNSFCCIDSLASITVVTPGNPDGWALYQTDNGGIINSGSQSGAAEFVNGPVPPPPLGTGSVHLMTGANHGDESAQLRNSSWAGTRIDELTALSYSTLATAWNGQQVPFLTIWLDLDGDTVRDDRLWFEPAYSDAGAGNGNPNPQPSVALGVWQTWDALAGMWYSDLAAGPGSNAITLAAYLALPGNANATIINDAGQGIGGIRVTSGFASASDDFNAYVDNFTIGTAANSITYDFELQDAGVVPEASSIIIWSVISLIAGSAFSRSRSCDIE